MRKPRLCPCGSGKPYTNCCAPRTEVNVRAHEFANPEEREKILKKLEISRTFNMRYKGLFEFYGDDLITYRQKKGHSKNGIEFLRLFSSYLTDYLENDCPPSWQECTPSFWETLLFIYYPTQMQISEKEKEVDIFTSQLKKFVSWLDRRTGTSWYGLVETYINESAKELRVCERLLNHLTLKMFPQLYLDDWDYQSDLERIEDTMRSADDRAEGYFEVTNIHNNITELTYLESGHIYHIIDLPSELMSKGMILFGTIIKNNGEMFWNWFYTLKVFPKIAKPSMDCILQNEA